MLSPMDYLVLYRNVQSREVEKYIVKAKEIKYAIGSMVEVYKPDPTLWVEKTAQVANYDDPAFRCAYLYKYAPLHTFLAQDIFLRALTESAAVINPNFWTNNSCLNICSLGGGPGIDVIGVLSALHRKYGILRCTAQIIESMSGWKDTFDTILEEFQNNHIHNGLSMNLKPQYFQSSYIVADLLSKMDTVVNKAIGSANLITMIKFISAATCVDTAHMIRKIFHSMRHGGVVFIIDNASGGYSELVSRIAEECRMLPVFGPLQYLQYTNAKFNVRKYGSRSCFSTQVTVHLLMKPYASYVEEWNFSLKPIIKDYNMKTDDCSSSEDDSAVSFGTSGYDSDYSKVDLRNFEPRKDKIIKINSIHRRQNKLNVAHNVDNDSNKKLSMAPGSDLFLSNKLALEECRVGSVNSYGDSFEIKPLHEVSSCEPIQGQASSLTDSDKSKPLFSEEKKFDYPLYELFPQNEFSANDKKSKYLKKLLTGSVDGSEVENRQKHAAPIFQIDSEKRVLCGKTETIQITENKDYAEARDIPHISESTIKEDTEMKRECSCCKLKRIKWLQKMCKICNT